MLLVLLYFMVRILIFCYLIVSIFSQLYGDQARFFDVEKVPRIKHKKKGTVSMVNNGSDQHGSQVRKWVRRQVLL